jgi:hypothetical protein
MRLAVGMAFDPVRLTATLCASQRATLVASGADGVPEVCLTCMALLQHNVSSAVAVARNAEALTTGAAHATAVLRHVGDVLFEVVAGGRLPHKCVARELVLAACADLRRRAEAVVLSTDDAFTGAKRVWDHAPKHERASKKRK